MTRTDKIVKAIPLDDYKILIESDGGVSGIFDVKPYLKGSAFKELENKAYFNWVRPARYGIAWPNEQDFSSDTVIWDIRNSREEQSARKER